MRVHRAGTCDICDQVREEANAMGCFDNKIISDLCQYWHEAEEEEELKERGGL